MESRGFGHYFGEAYSALGGFSGTLGILTTAGRIGSGYKQQLDKGSSPTTAFFASAGQFAAYRLYPSLMWSSFAASTIPQLMQAYDTTLAKRQNWWDNLRYPSMGVWFDTESALTMRQAAMQAIDESQMNARFTLGNEARMMHN